MSRHLPPTGPVEQLDLTDAIPDADEGRAEPVKLDGPLEPDDAAASDIDRSAAREAEPDEDTEPAEADRDGARPDRTRAERQPDADLARIHLRGGLIALARAELEQMAGAGTLDTPALADLAETRWRSGDLAGAADAAQAHLDAGGEEPMAMLICAEALDTEGHLIDARALAAKVLERVGGHVDRLFAGESRSSAWSTAGSMPTPLPPGTVAWGALAGGREISHPEDATWIVGPDAEQLAALEAGATQEVEAETAPETTATPMLGYPRGTISELVDAGRAAGRELDAVEAAIADGRLFGVPERLALLLRLDRALAPVILSHAEQALAAPGRDDTMLAALHLVRGDAFRSLGHEAEANAAYQQTLRALAARATTEETM